MSFDADVDNAMTDLSEAEDGIKRAIRRIQNKKPEAAAHLEVVLNEISIACIKMGAKPVSWSYQ